MHNLFITEDFPIHIFFCTKHSLHFHLASLTRELGSVLVTEKQWRKKTETRWRYILLIIEGICIIYFAVLTKNKSVLHKCQIMSLKTPINLQLVLVMIKLMWCRQVWRNIGQVFEEGYSFLLLHDKSVVWSILILVLSLY